MLAHPPAEREAPSRPPARWTPGEKPGRIHNVANKPEQGPGATWTRGRKPSGDLYKAAYDFVEHLRGRGFVNPAEADQFLRQGNYERGVTLDRVAEMGRTSGMFWLSGSYATREHFREAIADRLEGLIADAPKEISRFVADFNEEMSNCGGSLSGREIVTLLQQRGRVEVRGAYLVPASLPKSASPEQIALRARAQDTGAQAREVDGQGQRKRREPAQRSGWAVLGMLDAEIEHDRRGDGNKPVTYYDDAQRSQVVLRLVSGQFVDATGQVKQSPNYEGKSVGDILNSNPRAATVRYEELTGQSPMSGQRDWKVLEKIAEEFRNSARLIFVMKSSGQFFAGEGQVHVIHHSTFLAGGAVAAAGELGLQGGRPTFLSNESGHYQPGPAYMWQAVSRAITSEAPCSRSPPTSCAARSLIARSSRARR